MKHYISEEEAMYQDIYHGQFSRKLAKWAIGNMEVEDPATGKTKPVTMRSVDDVIEIFKANGVEVSDKYIYTVWYLFMMSIADYPKTFTTDRQRVSYVEETINDPDGSPSNVLACFVAKMCNAGIPIYWERFV